MKRFLSLLLVLLMLGSASAYAAGQVSFHGDVNVRSGPGLGYTSLGSIHSGATAEYLNDSAVDNRGVTWYKIAFSGGSGWVSSKWSVLEEHDYGNGWFVSEATWGEVRANYNVYVRSGPGLAYEKLTGMVPGDVATYLGNSSVDGRGVTWYNISFGQHTGWASSAFTELVTGMNLGNDYGYESFDSAGDYVEGVYGDSNVRTGPGLGYSSVGVLKKGRTATYLNEQSIDERGVAWYRISFNGHDAWVSSRYTILY